MRTWLLLLTILLNFGGFAQHKVHTWYFSDSLGLRFDSATPTLLFEGVTSRAVGSSVICDNEGDLLFYTDGETVWDRNHRVMSNGTGLFGNRNHLQSALILHKPQSTEYYIFTSGDERTPGYRGRSHYYSIVDLSKNHGLGTMVQKNQFLSHHGIEAIAGKRISDTSYCVAMIEYYQAKLLLYMLSPSGLKLVKEHPIDSSALGYPPSQLKFSSSGRYLAYGAYRWYCHHALHLLEIDPSSLELIQRQRVDSLFVQTLEFAPNEDFLYVMGRPTCGDATPNTLYQLPTSSFGKGIQNAVKLAQDIWIGPMSLTPYGDIYMMSRSDSGVCMNAVLEPDSAGMSCRYERDHVAMGSKARTWGIPNVCIDYILSPDLTVKNHCPWETFEFCLSNEFADSISWDFGDGTQEKTNGPMITHTFSSQGTYTVTYALHYSTHTDTFEQVIDVYWPDPPDLGPDSLCCNDEEILLQVDTARNWNIHWSTGSQEREIVPNLPGNYLVNTQSGECQLTDTVFLDFVDCGMLIDSACSNDTNTVSLLAQEVNANWFYSDGFEVKDGGLEVRRKLPAGTYDVKAIVSRNGLKRSIDSSFVVIDMDENPLEDKITACDSIQLNPTLTRNDYSIQWYPTTLVDNGLVRHSGTIYISVERKGCQTEDSCHVHIQSCDCTVFIPNAFSPNEDEFNRTFKPITECAIGAIRIEVYDRWGALKYKGNDSWDGTSGGRLCLPGVYLWTLSYKDPSGSTIMDAGTVHLLR